MDATWRRIPHPIPGDRDGWGKEHCLQDAGLRIWDEGEPVIWLACSLTEDTWNYGRRRWKKALESCTPRSVVVDMPDRGPKDSVVETLRAQGYRTSTHKVRCTDYGDAIAKVKWIVVGFQDGSQTRLVEGPRPTAVEVNGIDTVVRRNGGRRPGRCFEGSVTLSNRISTSGDRMLPWPAGHARGPDGGKKRLVYDIRGPALTPKRDEEMLIVDYLHKENPVRYLGVDEEWLANGGSRTQLQEARLRGMTDVELKGEVLRCMPQRTAHHLMGWMERARQAHGKVGVCRDEDRRRMDEVVQAWLRVWRGAPEAPRRGFEENLRSLDEKKVGGGVKRRRPGSAPPGEDVRPRAF